MRSAGVLGKAKNKIASCYGLSVKYSIYSIVYKFGTNQTRAILNITL